VIPPNTSEREYEVMTDPDGHPNAAIEVGSDSDIMVFSKDPHIAQLQISGPANEFSLGLQAKVRAAPMIDALGACRYSDESGERIRFAYRNYNTLGVESLLPVTTLSAHHLQNPTIPEDDLLLNDIRSISQKAVLPEGDLRAMESDITYQNFLSGDGSFTIPVESNDVPLAWSFIGKKVVADSSTTTCGGTQEPLCKQIPDEIVKGIYKELLKTVSGTLKAAAKVMKRGSSPYLKTSSQSIKQTKQIARQLLGSHICASDSIIPQGCVQRAFPRSALLRFHKGIFKRPSPTNRKLFEKIQRVFQRRYEKYLNTHFPDLLYMCPEQ
jgi:hypothetical protein